MKHIEDADLASMQKVCKMGRVCRICDRKFFLRASFEKHAKEIRHYSDLETKRENEGHKRERKLADLKNQILLYR